MENELLNILIDVRVGNISAEQGVVKTKELFKEYTSYKVVFSLWVEKIVGEETIGRYCQERMEFFEKSLDKAYDFVFKKYPNAKHVMFI